MNDHLTSALAQLNGAADWNERTGGTLKANLTPFEARDVLIALKELQHRAEQAERERDEEQKRAIAARADAINAQRVRDEAIAAFESHVRQIDVIVAENGKLRADLAEQSDFSGRMLQSAARQRQRVRKLEADNAAAREDSARLDWLEQHRNAGIGATATKRIAGLSRTLEDFRDYEWKGDTVRAAIDAARAGGAGK